MGNYRDKANSDEDGAMSKQITILPGQKNLEKRIRSKLDPKEKSKELTPWEKYQEKRKQKRKDRRQTASGNISSEKSKNNFCEKDARSKDSDDFFANDGDNHSNAKFEPRSQNVDLKNGSTS